MNIAPPFLKSMEYNMLKKKYGPCFSMAILVNIGLYCQETRKTTIKINRPEMLSAMFDVGDFDGDELIADLVDFELIEDVGDFNYRIVFFEDMNAQLITLWRNGERKKAKAMEQNKTEQNETKENKTELNRTELNGMLGNSSSIASASSKRSTSIASDEIIEDEVPW